MKFQKPIRQMDPIVRVDTDLVRIERRMVNLGER